MVDKDGRIVVKYVYDAFGNILQISGDEFIGKANPFRYKGYYYDDETGLYYNVTRYYNPQWGRFLSADDVSYLDPESINGLNLFAYCNNNPIMYIDPNGNFPILLILGGILIGGLISGVSSAITAPEGKRLAAFAGGFVKGAITTVAVGFALSTGGAGGLIAAVGGFVIAAVGGFAGGFLGSVTAQAIMSNDKIQLDTAAAHGELNAMTSVFMYLALNQLGVDVTSFLERLTSSIAPSTMGLSIASHFESLGFPNITETLHTINEKRNCNYNNSYNHINYRLHLLY